MTRPPGPNGRITMPRIARAVEMRKRGLSYSAIKAAMDVYEGDAPSEGTIRSYVLAAGMPKKPRGNAFRVGNRNGK